MLFREFRSDSTSLEEERVEMRRIVWGRIGGVGACPSATAPSQVTLAEAPSRVPSREGLGSAGRRGPSPGPRRPLSFRSAVLGGDQLELRDGDDGHVEGFALLAGDVDHLVVAEVADDGAPRPGGPDAGAFVLIDRDVEDALEALGLGTAAVVVDVQRVRDELPRPSGAQPTPTEGRQSPPFSRRRHDHVPSDT